MNAKQSMFGSVCRGMRFTLAKEESTVESEFQKNGISLSKRQKAVRQREEAPADKPVETTFLTYARVCYDESFNGSAVVSMNYILWTVSAVK